MEDFKKKLKEFFDSDINKSTDLRMVWDARKAFMRRQFIQHCIMTGSKKKKLREEKISNFGQDKNERRTKEIPRKENYFTTI